MMTRQVMPVPPARAAIDLRRRIPVWRLWAIIGAVLLAAFLVQLPSPRVADWSLFAFYDPGTTLKGDWLLSKGYLPTVDFGYTHGLVSLLFARAGFALLGRTPAAFFALTLLLELVMAWALARLLCVLSLRRASVVIFLVALPIAIMPAYLTLTHPLEAALILLALADQAKGNRARALALLTACLFVKPSMAYVYGFLLVILIIARSTVWQYGASLPKMKPSAAVLRALLPAAVILAIFFTGLAACFGIAPVLHTLLPLTGAKTYAVSGFGFFTPQGRNFWVLRDPLEYLITPVGVFLLATLLTAAGAGAAILIAARRVPPTAAPSPQPLSPRLEILLTVGILHTTFLLGFYGWTGSWTYYSYLPMLGLVLVADLLPITLRRGRLLSASLIALLALAQSGPLAATIGDWQRKEHTPPGLWAYPEQLAEWQRILSMIQSHNTTPHPPTTLVMTNGWLFQLPEGFQMPDAWFPESGIPTASEIARVQKQADAADFIILWQQYGPLDLWNSPEFAPQRAAFHLLFTGNKMLLLEHNTSPPPPPPPAK